MSVVTPFTTGQDEAAPLYDFAGDDEGPRMGKFTQPSAAPDNDLLVVWTPGPANDLDRPQQEPYYDGGLYLIELLSPVVLWLRGRWLYVAISTFLFFHLATFLSLGIHFLPTVVCWAAFLPLEKLPFLRARAPR